VGEQVLDDILLQLYRLALRGADEPFQDAALDQLRRLIAFDGAFWSRVSMRQGVARLHSAHLHRLDPELRSVWAQYEDRDVVGRLAMAQPGRTLNLVAEDVADPEVFREVGRRFGLGYLLTTSLLDPLTEMSSTVTLVRGCDGPPFVEAERLLAERLTPHLLQAYATDRMLRLRSEPTDGQLAYAVALADESGLLHFATPEFVTLIRSQWRAWTAPELPRELAGVHAGHRMIFGRIVVRTEPAGELVRLRARPRCPLDDLTEREAEVARLIATGCSNQQVADILGLSPFTVRNQLNRDFGKLGVGSRAALGRFAYELGSMQG
jgi:DNA-binding CsgD family transcriptional regulator